MSQPQALARILDANLNRAREGVRVIEDWCRLGLNNPIWANQCKIIRQQLAKWHSDELKLARDTAHDLGTSISHPQEETRENIDGLLRANFARVAEALRVLEEYGKLHDQQMARDIKKMRYEIYILETEICDLDRLGKLKNSLLYLVTSPHENLLNIVESALDAGLSLVQYREKNADDLTRYNRAEKLSQLCKKYDALFLVNDRIDIALAVEADGVHLGQQDLPLAQAKKLLGHGLIVGRSTTNSQEMELSQGSDYIGVGPIYETPTKVGKTPVGFEYIHYAKEHSIVPWFAIGGIDRDNLTGIVEAGARQVAVVRAIMASEDPGKTTRELLSILQSHKQS